MASATATAPTVSSASDADRARRQELGDFLRSRRERIGPEQVGLALGGRRRTPGLRREEVAGLSGVGVTWYTWLEQGRDIRASEAVLNALARTLMLDQHERLHLFTLAGAPSIAVATDCNAIEPSVALMLERLGAYPGAVFNRRFDILAHNAAYAGLLGDLDALPFDERNLLWLMFTKRSMRDLLGDYWSTASRRCVAQCRAGVAELASEPAWRALVKRLSAASPEFAARWREHDVAPTDTTTKQFLHPDLGTLRFTATNLWLGRRVGNRLAVYTPVDESTAARIERLPALTPRPFA